jgi:pimeloyl-ACP methyl ester carboxylesterase
MSTPREGSVAVNGLRLHWLEWGQQDAPTLLLLHGASAHAHWWDFFAEPLATTHRLFALDLRGHGNSEWADPPLYGVAAHADDVCAAAAALAPGRFTLIGHSLGGLVAITASERLRERLAALVVIDSSARISERSARLLTALRMFPHPIYPTLDEAVRRFRLLPAVNGARTEVLAHVARHAMCPAEQGGWTLKFDRRSVGQTRECDLAPLLADVRAPVLLVRGGNSEVLSARAFARLATAVPGAEAVEIPSAHHHVMLDTPTELARAVSDFIQRRVH